MSCSWRRAGCSVSSAYSRTRSRGLPRCRTCGHSGSIVPGAHQPTEYKGRGCWRLRPSAVVAIGRPQGSPVAAIPPPRNTKPPVPGERSRIGEVDPPTARWWQGFSMTNRSAPGPTKKDTRWIQFQLTEGAFAMVTEETFPRRTHRNCAPLARLWLPACCLTESRAAGPRTRNTNRLCTRCARPECEVLCLWGPMLWIRSRKS
jgi:hypothetical protein